MLRYILFFSSIFLIFEVYSVEVGDKVSFIKKEFNSMSNEVDIIEYTLEITRHDPETDSFILKTTFTFEDGLQETGKIWLPRSRFPSWVRINSLLENCELVEGRIEYIKLRVGRADDAQLHKVCVSRHKIFRFDPTGNGFEYYYGHFPIFGTIKIKTFDDLEALLPHNEIL